MPRRQQPESADQAGVHPVAGHARPPMRTLSRLILAAPILLGCGATPPASSAPTAAIIAYCGSEARAGEVERRIDGLLPRLSLSDKVALMHGSIIQADGTWPAVGIDEFGIPTLAMIDGPRGVGRAAGPATAFPVAMARGATFDPEMERRIGEAIGREAHASGAAVILAPTMNVLRHPRWGRAQETYGEDPHHIGALALAFVEGAQRHVLATAKHFAVNSIENTRLKVDVTVDEQTLREIYLPHFRRVVVEGRVGAVMAAYNSVNGSFCSENDHLLREILKGEWSFAGPVMSDWLWGTHDTLAASRAGLDLEMPFAKVYGDPLQGAVEAGQVPLSTVDDSVRRVLRARFCYRVDTAPPTHDLAARETPDHVALAGEAAERSLVLLTNPGGLLPLARAKLRKIVVTGKLADSANIGDRGSSSVMPSHVVTPLAGLRAAAPGVEVVHLAAPPSSPADDALLAAADAVIVIAGLTSDDEGEAQVAAGDRKSLALPADQVAWIRAVAARSDRVVVVLEAGAALTVGDLVPEVEAMLFAWYPGMEGGTAIARVLLGDVNPSGRLPLVFPAREADLPPFDNTSEKVAYGPLHGYRHLDEIHVAPLFPFGFGLSYTTFAVANLLVEPATASANGTVRATCDVTNTGAKGGRHTVQLYVGGKGALRRPVRALRGFSQVDLNPGETRAVTIEVKIEDLASWDEGAAAFRVEPADYTFEVGASSRDLPLHAVVTVTP
ncbi:MAG: glycosyl hydrolase [Myxococcales bacterium]|nr:glycosyl hydrolase [Myxococcales bacterium]